MNDLKQQLINIGKTILRVSTKIFLTDSVASFIESPSLLEFTISSKLL